MGADYTDIKTWPCLQIRGASQGGFQGGVSPPWALGHMQRRLKEPPRYTQPSYPKSTIARLSGLAASINQARQLPRSPCHLKADLIIASPVIKMPSIELLPRSQKVRPLRRKLGRYYISEGPHRGGSKGGVPPLGTGRNQIKAWALSDPRVLSGWVSAPATEWP